jgi:serine/threonine protein kinase
MADADWINYRQIRGKPLPPTIEFHGAVYALAKVFKRDFYAATGLYELSARRGSPDPAASPDTDLPARVVFKHYHTDRFGPLPLRWLGRFLWRREMRLGQAVKHVQGVAHILGRYGKSGLIREYVPGRNLREFLVDGKLGNTFFRDLKQSLRDVHACGIAHNDLNKPENILVREDGSPVLIDFQIALESRSRIPVLGHLGRAVIRYLQRMDWYHLLKHQRRNRPQDFTAEELKLADNRGILLNLHAWLLRRPYRAVRHVFMRMLVNKPV